MFVCNGAKVAKIRAFTDQWIIGYFRHIIFGSDTRQDQTCSKDNSIQSNISTSAFEMSIGCLNLCDCMANPKRVIISWTTDRKNRHRFVCKKRSTSTCFKDVLVKAVYFTRLSSTSIGCLGVCRSATRLKLTKTREVFNTNTDQKLTSAISS